MYTIKFINNYSPTITPNTTISNAISNTTVVSCEEYEVYRCEHHALVLANGIERRVHGNPTQASGNNDPLPAYYDVAYVENAAGKTIDKIGPYETHDWHGEMQNNLEVRDAA